jgi:GWxTD domain-containing protein
MQDGQYNAVSLIKKARELALVEKTEEATQNLYQGLEGLGNHMYADTVFKEVWDLLSAEESRAYPSAKDKGAFLLQFWQSIDPTPATLANERYVEHQQRLAYARQWYSSPQPRGYDDRGMIYVRYGKPYDYVVFRSGKFVTKVDRGKKASFLIKPNEGWLYLMPERVMFDFIETGAHYRIVTDWREAIKLAGVRIDYLPVPRGMYEPSGDAKGYSDNLLVQNRLPHYKTTLERKEYPLKAVLGFARFWERDRYRLELYYGMPCGEIVCDTSESGMLFSHLDLEYTVRDSLYRIQSNRRETRTVRRSIGENPANLHISQVNESFNPGVYYYSIQIKNPSSNKAIEKMYKLSFPPDPGQHLYISDIEKALQVEPLDGAMKSSLFRKGNLLVTPYPSSAVFPKRPSTFYFEVYNLLIGPNGRTEYEVSYELRSKKSGLISKLNPFGRETTALSTGFRQTGERRDEQVYFSLDFSRVEPGDYTLEITVMDQVSGETRKAEMALKLVE